MFSQVAAGAISSTKNYVAEKLIIQSKLMINDHEVVEKSYPEYWQHLEKAGIKGNVW